MKGQGCLLFFSDCVQIQENSSMFGFPEFVASLAILILVWTTASDFKYKLRTRASNLQTEALLTTGALGLLCFTTDAVITNRIFMPSGFITVEAWRTFLAAMFITIVSSWVFRAFSRPSSFNSRNHQAYSDMICTALLSSSDSDFKQAIEELRSSIESIAKAYMRNKNEKASKSAGRILYSLATEPACDRIFRLDPLFAFQLIKISFDEAPKLSQLFNKNPIEDMDFVLASSMNALIKFGIHPTSTSPINIDWELMKSPTQRHMLADKDLMRCLCRWISNSGATKNFYRGSSNYTISILALHLTCIDYVLKDGDYLNISQKKNIFNPISLLGDDVFNSDRDTQAISDYLFSCIHLVSMHLSRTEPETINLISRYISEAGRHLLDERCRIFISKSDQYGEIEHTIFLTLLFPLFHSIENIYPPTEELRPESKSNKLEFYQLVSATFLYEYILGTEMMLTGPPSKILIGPLEVAKIGFLIRNVMFIDPIRTPMPVREMIVEWKNTFHYTAANLAEKILPHITIEEFSRIFGITINREQGECLVFWPDWPGNNVCRKFKILDSESKVKIYRKNES